MHDDRLLWLERFTTARWPIEVVRNRKFLFPKISGEYVISGLEILFLDRK